jgi:hypothetical protein
MVAQTYSMNMAVAVFNRNPYNPLKISRLLNPMTIMWYDRGRKKPGVIRSGDSAFHPDCRSTERNDTDNG